MAWTRARSFRRSLITNLALIVVTFGVIMAGVSYAAVRFSARRASEAMMTQVVDGLAEADDGFYRSVEKIFILADFWATRTWSGGFDTYEFDRTFPPLLLAFYEASSFYIALGSGDLYMISRDGGEWISWTARPIAWGDRAIVRTWTDERPIPEEKWVKLNFDVTGCPGSREPWPSCRQRGCRHRWRAAPSRPRPPWPRRPASRAGPSAWSPAPSWAIRWCSASSARWPASPPTCSRPGCSTTDVPPCCSASRTCRRA